MILNIPNVLTPIQEEIITGTLLGDACVYLPKTNINPHLSIKRKLSDRPYLEWQASFFKDFTQRPVHETTYNSSKWDTQTQSYVKYKYTAIQYISRSSKAFLPIRNKWYPAGKKIVPRDLKLTPLILMEWFCDDGTAYYVENKNSISVRLVLCTMGFVDDDISFLRNLLEARFNEKFSINKNRVLYCSDTPTRLFLKDIDSIIPPGMERKAIWRDPKIQFYTKIDLEKSRLKKREELRLKIKDFIENNKKFTIMELCKYTGNFFIINGKLEPDYQILTKYLLLDYKDILYKEGSSWIINK
jgi:hypothetical protein